MYICRVGINEENIYAWKQPPRGVPMKRCSENTQQIYRTSMPKCAFNKIGVLL